MILWKEWVWNYHTVVNTFSCEHTDTLLTTSSKLLSNTKIVVCWFNFYWKLFPMVQLRISRNASVSNRREAIIWTDDRLVYWPIHASHGLADLMPNTTNTYRVPLLYSLLTHLPLDKIASISQTMLSDAFSWMKSLYFDYNFTEGCSYGSNWL